MPIVASLPCHHHLFTTFQKGQNLLMISQTSGPSSIALGQGLPK